MKRQIAAKISTLTVGLGLALSSSLAFAHPHLLSENPPKNATITEMPKQVDLRFSEALEPTMSKIEVKNVATNEILNDGRATVATDQKDLQVKLKPFTQPGQYNVSWRAMSKDTHHVKGEYHFTYIPKK